MHSTVTSSCSHSPMPQHMILRESRNLYAHHQSAQECRLPTSCPGPEEDLPPSDIETWLELANAASDLYRNCIRDQGRVGWAWAGESNQNSLHVPDVDESARSWELRTDLELSRQASKAASVSFIGPQSQQKTERSDLLIWTCLIDHQIIVLQKIIQWIQRNVGTYRLSFLFESLVGLAA